VAFRSLPQVPWWNGRQCEQRGRLPRERHPLMRRLDYASAGVQASFSFFVSERDRAETGPTGRLRYDAIPLRGMILGIAWHSADAKARRENGVCFYPPRFAGTGKEGSRAISGLKTAAATTPSGIRPRKITPSLSAAVTHRRLFSIVGRLPIFLMVSISLNSRCHADHAAKPRQQPIERTQSLRWRTAPAR